MNRTGLEVNGLEVNDTEVNGTDETGAAGTGPRRPPWNGWERRRPWMYP